MRIALRFWRTAMVLLQAKCPHISDVLTVLEDAHVFLLGEDGVVGLQAVLLEHLLIAVGVSDVGP